jgi:hypothetical protein
MNAFSRDRKDNEVHMRVECISAEHKTLLSVGGHYFDPQQAEKLIEAIRDSLKEIAKE